MAVERQKESDDHVNLAYSNAIKLYHATDRMRKTLTNVAVDNEYDMLVDGSGDR